MPVFAFGLRWTPIGLDALQSFQIDAQLAAQIAFDHILALLDGVHNLRHLLLAQVLRPD
jgi:hypothetical protein